MVYIYIEVDNDDESSSMKPDESKKKKKKKIRMPGFQNIFLILIHCIILRFIDTIKN